VNSDSDLLDRSFQLAQFILHDRPAAIATVTSAFDKLQVRRAQENKRVYWRDKFLKRRINQVSRNDADVLQWLILFESDRHEKEQEERGDVTPRMLLLRYVKTIVRTTAAMSSFHVNVGVNRLLYNYTTSEAQQLYEFLTEHYVGADEYRRAKSVLMNRITTRLGRFLRPITAEHGEHRFESLEGKNDGFDLVQQCLTAFIPWSTAGRCFLPDRFKGGEDILSPALSGKNRSPSEQDEVESNRQHAFLEPACYCRLTRAVGLDPPEQRLAIPRFIMRNDTDNKNSDPKPPADVLTDHERRLIHHRLATEAARRKRVSAKYITINLDGRDSARLQLDEPGQTVFEIQEGAALLELWSGDERSELLLAAHFVPYVPGQGISPATFTTKLNGGRNLTLTITPANPSGGQHHAFGILKYKRSAVAMIGPGWSATLKYALAPIIFVVLALSLLKTQRQLASARHLLQKNSSEMASVIARRDEVAVPLTPVRSYRLIPDEAITRGGAGAGIPSIPIGPRPTLITLQLPTAEDGIVSYRAVLTPFMKSTEIVSENQLAPINTSSGRMVEFVLPSTLVRASRDYSISLRGMNSKGTWNEISSFTFHVSPSHEATAPR
jgi:hypothetical protein